MPPMIHMGCNKNGNDVCLFRLSIRSLRVWTLCDCRLHGPFRFGSLRAFVCFCVYDDDGGGQQHDDDDGGQPYDLLCHYVQQYDDDDDGQTCGPTGSTVALSAAHREH